MKKALIIVDLQNDFMPSGTLPVPEGDVIIPLINRLMPIFDIVIATKDWHPADHGSFACNHSGANPGDLRDLDGLEQILWPDHCIENTKGAEFVKELDVEGIDAVFEKGTNPNIDSYSGFFDNGQRSTTGLDTYLKEQEIKQVYITGVATEYCVKFTALDAISTGFETYLIEDACRGVNLENGDVAKAIDEMKKQNVRTTTTVELLQ